MIKKLFGLVLFTAGILAITFPGSPPHESDTRTFWFIGGCIITVSGMWLMGRNSD